MMFGTVVGTIAIVAVTIAIGMLVDRRAAAVPSDAAHREEPRAAHLAPGETAVTAIRAGDAQLARLRAAQRCSECRGEMIAQADDAAQLGGQRLVLLRFRCARCDARRTIYVRPV
jgi:hypothetical protein